MPSPNALVSCLPRSKTKAKKIYDAYISFSSDSSISYGTRTKQKDVIKGNEHPDPEKQEKEKTIAVVQRTAPIHRKAVPPYYIA